MASGTTLRMEQFVGKEVNILAYDDVANAADVCVWVRQPGADFAALDASMVVGIPQIFAAALSALHAESRDKLVTHALHSEIVYALSAAKQINEAFRRFGASDSSTRLVIVTFDAAAALRLKGKVRGTLVDLQLLAAGFDETAVRKAYKITDVELRVGSLLDAIVSRIAIQRL